MANQDEPQIGSSKPRSAILDAAVRLFGKQGYSGTSMRDIAKAVGVLPGSLYAHIDSKETLLVEIVDDGISNFFASVEAATSNSAPIEGRLRAAIIAHVQVVAQNPERSLVVFHQWRFLSEANLATAVAERRRYEKLFVDLVQTAVRDGIFQPDLNVRIAVLTILGALNWTPEWYSAAGPNSPAEIGQKLADTLICGLISR